MNGGQAGIRSDRDKTRVCDAMELSSAAVIVNADDWGRDVFTTDRCLECVLLGAVSSVSAMVFMEDSERAADLAKQHGVDAGLHLNFTLPYSDPHCPSRLMEHQGRLSRFLKSHRLAPLVYHPSLASSFDYVVKMQLDEYERQYGAPPSRVDGHHHMHLCSNVTLQELIPRDVIVRRNLSFGPGEKGYLNRFYRRWQDRRLARRHRLADFFFDLQPLEPRQRLAGILELATRFDVEVETHPAREEEYRFLVNGGVMQRADEVGVARGYSLRFCISSSRVGRISWIQQAWK